MRIILFSSKSTLVDFIRSLSFFILIKSFYSISKRFNILFEKKKNFIKVFLFSLKTLDQLNPFQDYFVTHVSIINSILSNLVLTRSSLINRTFFILIFFFFYLQYTIGLPKVFFFLKILKGFTTPLRGVLLFDSRQPHS